MLRHSCVFQLQHTPWQVWVLCRTNLMKDLIEKFANIWNNPERLV